MTGEQPLIVVGISLGAPLHPLAARAQADAIAREAGSRLTQVASDLGIPGHVTAQVGSDNDAAARPVAVSVHDRRIEYPRSLDQQVLVVRRHQRESRDDGTGLPTWREQLAADEAQSISAVAEVAAHAVALNASALLGAAQVAAWRKAAPQPVADDTGDVLRELLDLRLRISDHSQITATLARSTAMTAADAAEHVIEAIRPDIMEARVEPRYLEEITKASADSGHNKFPFLRDGLYLDLGLRLPSLRLVPDPEMASCCYAIRVNHLSTPPVLGPPPGMCLVNAPVEQIASIVPTARGALNPASDIPGAFAPAATRDELELRGYTTWDPIGHLVLTLADTARAHSRGLIDRGVVARELGLLRQFRPALTRSVQSSLPIERLTRLLRSLLAERVSIRDLERLCQELADQAVGGLPDSDEALLVLARRASSAAITSASASRGHIVAYLLDPSFEADLAAADAETARTAGRSVIAALDAELAVLPLTVTRPLLLTTATARLPLRRAIKDAWPRMTVLAYEELDPAADVIPKARLSPAASLGEDHRQRLAALKVLSIAWSVHTL